MTIPSDMDALTGQPRGSTPRTVRTSLVVSAACLATLLAAAFAVASHGSAAGWVLAGLGAALVAGALLWGRLRDADDAGEAAAPPPDAPPPNAGDERVRRLEAALADANRQLARARDEARRMAEDADRVGAARTRFVADLSQEVRAPVNGLMGMLTLLADTPLDATQRNYVTMAEGSARSLLSLVDDVLDLARLDAGCLDLAASEFALRDVIAATQRVLSPQAEAKGIAISAALDPDVPRRVVGDAARLRKVLLHLADNAVGYTDRGGVAIRVSREDEEGDRSFLRFTVTDTGIGVPSDRLDTIFEPFAQADGGPARRCGGSGLGLSICRRLVERMGGRIGVLSAVGRGSTFWFTVALGAADTAPDETTEGDGRAPTPTLVDATLRGLRVLVADDNFVSQRFVLGLLRRFGCDADVVGDGVQALAAVSTRPYDVVILDREMPGLDGSAVARAIRDPASGALDHDVPIIALTGPAETSDDGERCRAAGMDRHVSKPVDPVALRAAIQAARRARDGGAPARDAAALPA